MSAKHERVDLDVLGEAIVESRFLMFWD